jgi:hypothetical protein
VHSLKRANLHRKWSTIPRSRACPNKQWQHFAISRHASPRGSFLFRQRLKIARGFRFDHGAC